MKKLLFIIILLLTPFVVFADDVDEEDFFDPIRKFSIAPTTVFLPYQGQFGSTSDEDYMFSTDYTYEDGVYTLTGNIRFGNYYFLSTISPFSSYDVLYTCRSKTEITCEELWHVFVNNRLSYSGTAYGIRVPGGKTLEDVRYLTVGNSFVKEGNTYKLVDIEQFDKAAFNHVYYQVPGKYVCNNFETECDEIGLIEGADRDELKYVTPNQKPIVGKSYEINANGKYVLKDIVEDDWWPNYEELVGNYICYSENPYECDELAYLYDYTPERYDNFGDQFEMMTYRSYDFLILSQDSSEVEVKIGDEILLEDYFDDSDVYVMDESILKIKNGKIVPLKVGDTYVLGKSQSIAFGLHVIVSQEMLDAYNAVQPNPKTKTGIMVIASTVIALLLVIVFAIKKKKYN